MSFQGKTKTTSDIYLGQYNFEEIVLRINGVSPNWKVFVPKVKAITAKERKWKQLAWGCQVKSSKVGSSRVSNQNVSFLKEMKGAGSSWPGKNSWPFLLIPLSAPVKLGKVGEKRDISCILQPHLIT